MKCIDKIKCKLFGHKYEKFSVTFQALSGEGIAYRTTCERCEQRASASFNYNVNPNEFENKKLICKYVSKYGYTY